MDPDPPLPTPTPFPTPTPTTIVLPPPRERLFGRFGKWLLVALGIALVALAGMAARVQHYFGDGSGPSEVYHSLSKTADEKVAIVEVAGAIMEGDDFVEDQLERIEKDESVVAVVLRIDSPGGTVTKSDRLLHLARKLRDERKLPMVVSMGSLCASGGYYVAMAVGDQENAIYAEPTSWTGSIGVVIPSYNFSRTMNILGAQDLSVVSGDLKLMGSPTRPRSEKEAAVLQELVDLSFEGFKEVVRSGRPKFRDDAAALDAVATGQVFTAKQALESGLVDRLGYVEDAVERACELAGVKPTNVRCVEYQKQVSPIDAILGASAPATPARSEGIDLGALIELSAPRAYYVSTLAPVLLRKNDQ